jgi:hypothetical protein
MAAEQRDYTAGGLRIPRRMNPPWYMDDRNIGLVFLGYLMLVLGLPALAMTFGWGGSHW